MTESDPLPADPTGPSPEFSDDGEIRDRAVRQLLNEREQQLTPTERRVADALTAKGKAESECRQLRETLERRRESERVDQRRMGELEGENRELRTFRLLTGAVNLMCSLFAAGGGVLAGMASFQQLGWALLIVAVLVQFAFLIAGWLAYGDGGD